MGKTKTCNTTARIIERSAKIAKVMELRREGYTFTEIADAVGVSIATAFCYVRDAIKRANAKADANTIEHRNNELAKLDTAEIVVWEMIASPRERERATGLDRLMKIMDRRAQLLGLDAPAQKHVTLTADVYNHPPRDQMKAAILERIQKLQQPQAN